jgi:hypothetical protein
MIASFSNSLNSTSNTLLNVLFALAILFGICLSVRDKKKTVAENTPRFLLATVVWLVVGAICYEGHRFAVRFDTQEHVKDEKRLMETLNRTPGYPLMSVHCDEGDHRTNRVRDTLENLISLQDQLSNHRIPGEILVAANYDSVYIVHKVTTPTGIALTVERVPTSK